MDDRPDQELIAACLAGDKQAWTVLIERYERLIYSIPLRYRFSQSQAADIFQDVCLIMLEKLEDLRDEARLASWLGTVTRRECWKVMRRRDAAGVSDPIPFLVEQPAADSKPDDIVTEWEAWQAVRHAFNELNERCRNLLQLLYYTTSPPSYEVIAAELGIRVGSIGPTRARCLKRLHYLMRGEHYRVEA